MEQVASQENKACEESLCENTLVQTQLLTPITLVGEGQGSSYSAEVEQSAEQENVYCKNGAFCVNNAVQFTGTT